MDIFFSKKKIVNSVLSPFNHYCAGYPGSGCYITALVIGAGCFQESFSHAGSGILDSIVAYDKAETSEAYLGQINMTLVSSFCGPQGLIWGHDIARKEDIPLSSIHLEKFQGFRGIKIKNGETLRKAAVALFGTNKERHFPFFPGTHVPCAGRYYTRSGPTTLYGAIAIGVPRERNESACLIMEDVGEITSPGRITKDIKEKIMFNAIRSVIEVGENQNTAYKEIFVDFISKEIKAGEIGCVLIAMPYFLLAQKAFNKNLINQTLEEWIENSQKHFLCNPITK